MQALVFQDHWMFIESYQQCVSIRDLRGAS